MARTAITVTTSDHDGVTYPTPQSNDASGMEIEDNDGQVILVLTNINTGGGDITVTVQAAATYGVPPIPLVDRTYAIGPGETVVAGGFASRLFNQVGDLSQRSVLVDFTGVDGDIDVVGLQVPISGT